MSLWAEPGITSPWGHDGLADSQTYRIDIQETPGGPWLLGQVLFRSRPAARAEVGQLDGLVHAYRVVTMDLMQSVDYLHMPRTAHTEAGEDQ